MLSLVTADKIDGFVNGVIPAQAVLLGFSFTVMFFLVSSQTMTAHDDSLESEILAQKINKLSIELFHNVSYFNVCAIGCIVFSLSMLLDTPRITQLRHLLNAQLFSSVSSAYVAFFGFMRIAAKFSLYFLLIESVYTFFRTIIRINYLFDRKIGNIS